MSQRNHQSQYQVVVVDDNPAARESIALVLREAGHSVMTCGSGSEALAQVARSAVDVVVTDLQMPGMNGLELVRELMQSTSAPQVLMITAHASVATAVEAMRLGAFDYIEKPFDAERLEQSVARACMRRGLTTSSAAAGDSLAPRLVGSSQAMQRLTKQIARMAATDETVLICGESGTGKELVAQSLHALSSRAAGPMISLNCPVLSEQLTESELFGHRRGAFTGAERDRTGRFEAANGGTLLLDEVTEIDLGLQAKLLRVLQERKFEPVGSSETIAIDVRVLATTNRDLQSEVAAGRFREDLFYRLAVLPVHVPPLRDREHDVVELAEYFISEARSRLNRDQLTLATDVHELLSAYNWPGNVRELHNVITRACVLSSADTITSDLVRPWLGEIAIRADEDGEDTLTVGMSLAQMERKLILATLTRNDGHRARTAEALGIGVRTLSGKLRDMGVGPGEKSLARAS
jgi:DNA-binding NtrC family response regulator